MKSEEDGRRLRIYVNESDRWEGRPLYEYLVRAARDQGLAGATALRGIEGFGTNQKVHTVKVLHLSEDLPIVVEIVDRADRIAAFMATVDKMVGEGMVTVESVGVLRYRREGEQETNQPPEYEEIPLESEVEATSVEPQMVSQDTTEDARRIIQDAKQAAAKCRRVFVDSVDVLLTMLRNSDGVATTTLRRLGADIRTVTRALREEVSRDEPSGAYLTSLQAKSAAAAKWLEVRRVGTEHLLLGLCEIRPSAATDVLTRSGIQPRDVCKAVLEILGHEDDWQRWLADHPDM